MEAGREEGAKDEEGVSYNPVLDLTLIPSPRGKGLSTTLTAAGRVGLGP